MITEEDFASLSPVQLKRYKEQLITDMMCAIPQTLDIDTDMQEILGTRQRVKQWIKEEFKKNWLGDWFTRFAL
eukprot:CAMPEP_0170486140 /NCGR_PEP_ID=MMETSP0208-20121228/5221_1 /TAXON_ID=197538 /ORGANISM="Strombidium inclinatum, Strain S3" /LENGTH=72 /DNA_ID=CAMNT_0010759983 /DNA_START=593 /DNA_END=807 /DNA_ORIENTATION=-